MDILKVLVGSRAHGLESPDSDWDYRGVYVTPTSDILKIGGAMKDARWTEGDIDSTAWEVGHFLRLATKCNPTILETFLAPVEEINGWGTELRALFPYVWNATGVRDAFIGYGLNQRKKFLEAKDGRPAKYAVAYLRTLFQAWELLVYGNFTIRVIQSDIGPQLLRWKAGDYTVGEVVESCLEWQRRVEEVYLHHHKHTELGPVNDFLLRLRKEYWS